jgi:RNA polymerase sigma-70 factor (ECF subfamily)
MSAAAILSVAARKAAMEAKKVGAQAMVFVLFLMLAIGAFVNFTGRGTQTQQVAESQAPTTTEEPLAPAPSASASESAAPSGEVVQIPAIETPSPANTAKPALPVTNLTASAPSATPSANPVPAKALTNIYLATPDVAFVSKAEVKQNADTRQDYMVAASQGAFADFSFDANSDDPFKNVMFTLTLDGKQFRVYASKSETAIGIDKQGMQHFVYYSSMKYLVDSRGKVWDQSEISKGTIRLELVVDNVKRTVEDSVLTIMPSEK